MKINHCCPTYALNNNNLAFGRKAIYAVNADGELRLFSSTAEASKQLNISQAGIYNCISKKNWTKTAGGYAFCDAKSLDIYEKDSEEYKSKVQEFAQMAKYAKALVPIYAISAKGDVIAFETMTEAAKALGTSTGNITMCLNNKYPSKTALGYVFCKQDELDELDKNSEEYAKKIEDLKLIAKNPGRTKACYGIDAEGKVYLFKSQKEASEKLQLNDRQAISNCVNGIYNTTKGYTFCNAEELDKLEKDSDEYRKKIEQLRSKIKK